MSIELVQKLSPTSDQKNFILSSTANIIHEYTSGLPVLPCSINVIPASSRPILGDKVGVGV